MNIYRVFIDGIFDREDWFIEALGLIDPAQVVDKETRAVYRILQNEYFNGGVTPNRRVFPDMVTRRFKERTARKLTEFLLSIESRVPDYRDFKHAIIEMLREAKLEQIKGNIARGLHQLKERRLTGIADVLVSGLDSFDNEGSSEGDARKAVTEMLERRKEPLAPGIRVGIPELDALTGGGRPGQMWIWGAYTGEGKTKGMIEMAYHMILEGRNVIWITLEMEREEMEELFVIRHAHRFCPDGLDAKEVELRCLSDTNEQIFLTTAMDWRDNPDYGSCYIWKPNRNATLNTVETKLQTIRSLTGAEVVFLDYLEILAAVKRRDQYRLEVKEKAQRFKRAASDLGMFAVTGHQISRDGKKGAAKRGYYLLSDLGESSGVEQNASLVAWSLRTEEMVDANLLRFGIMKNRHGGTLYSGVDVVEDFIHGRICFGSDDRPESE